MAIAEHKQHDRTLAGCGAISGRRHSPSIS
jgi:hypothetical protein